MDKASRDKSLGITARSRNSIQQAVNLIDPRNEGVVFLGIKKLFNQIEADNEASYCVRMSYVEIYNESVYDLLGVEKDVQGSLQIVENPKTNDFWIRGVNEIIIADAEEAIDLIMSGEENRHFAATALNHHSSRSHCLIRLFVKKIGKNETVFEGICNFVDLAGSEKLSGMLEDKKSNARSKGKDTKSISERLQESKHINKSLFFLTQIIYMKSRNTKAFIPYRNSSLTKILKNSIGGNARTTIILCVNPLFKTLAETLSTLRFGQRAKKIVNTVSKNESKEGDVEALKNLVADYEKKIREMENAMKNNNIESLNRSKLRQSFGPRKSNLMKLIENLQNQKVMLESRLLRRSSILNMFKKSKFAPSKEDEQQSKGKTELKAVYNDKAGLLYYFGEQVNMNKTGTKREPVLANREYVKSALQNDYVRNVKKRNSELHKGLKHYEHKTNKLIKKCDDQAKTIHNLHNLIDMLLNKQPEHLLNLDNLSRDLLISNATLTIQNLSTINTVSSVQALSLLNPENQASPKSPQDRINTINDQCTKIGFKYSGTYLTRGNLEIQLFGKEDTKKKISSIYESRKNSLMTRRLTQRSQHMWRSGNQSNLDASRALFNQSLLSQNPESLDIKVKEPSGPRFSERKSIDKENVRDVEEKQRLVPKGKGGALQESREDVSQNILLSKQSTNPKISLTVEESGKLMDFSDGIKSSQVIEGEVTFLGIWGNL